jgi:uncharacterized membrane protein required for colicin V production
MLFDALVVGFVALAAGIGAWKGFAWQLGATLAPIAGLAAGWPLSAGLAPHLGLRAPMDRWAAFALLYMLITLLLYVAALALRRLLERAELGGWDRHLGFAAGALKGFALAVLLTAGALSFSKELRAQIPGTRAGGLMAQALRTVRPALPRSAAELLGPWFELLDPPQRRNV